MWSISQNTLCDGGWQRIDSDVYLALFTQRIGRSKRREIHDGDDDDDDDNVCKWLIESVFILIEQFYLTEVSFRYSPGKQTCELLWVFFCSKSTVVFSQTSQTFVWMLKTRFMRMCSVFVLKDCYWVSPWVFVYRAKTFSSNTLISCTLRTECVLLIFQSL